MIFTLLIFLLLIGILVFVHELGHFLTARLTGMRADVFAIGMGPRVVGWNAITGLTFGKLPDTVQLGDKTDYRLCAFPIGGYVKILGMVDESMDTEGLASEPKKWEFRSKNAAQKTLVLVAGVAMNILLAIGIFAGLDMAVGVEEHVVTSIADVESGSVAYDAGLRAGDNILAVNDVPMAVWEDLTRSISQGNLSDIHLTVKRPSGGTFSAVIPSSDVVSALAEGKGLGLSPSGVAVELGSVFSLKPAGKAGLAKGDVVLAVDSTPVRSVLQFQRYVRSRAGQTIVVHIDRSGTTKPIAVTVGQDSVIGVEMQQQWTVPVRIQKSGPMEALQAGFVGVGNTVAMIGSSLWHMVSGTVSVKQSVGGPVKIAKMAAASSERGLEPFLRFMALISVSLAVMNLLPLPGLDGGHLVFVAVEAIIRREIPTSVKIRIQQVGMVLLLALMAFILILDLT
jgi:regulator of sigma E protease